MKIEFDPEKDATNIAKHGLSLAQFDGFDSDPVFEIDDRRAYGEIRYRAFGRVDGAGRCLVFTLREGAMRLISFRAARHKELRHYE